MKTVFAAGLAIWTWNVVGRAGEVIPFDDGRWAIEAGEHRLETYKGRSCLFLKDGMATLRGENMLDGTIECDIALPNERGFMGVFWRMQGSADYEEFYLRPHQSGKPDANQYTPVFNGFAGWQLYHGEDYATQMDYPFGEWMHLKLVFSGNRAEIYIDSETPTLIVPELKREALTGLMGVKAAFAPARFANFRFEPGATQLAATQAKAKPGPENRVTRWSLALYPAGEAKLNARLTDTAPLHWTSMAAEATGILNLARLAGVSRGNNTVLARLVLNSERQRSVPIAFGYSDRVRVYINGNLLYAGQNNYRSRDFRYLGTIGLFDQIHAALNTGRNEIIFAVSESFGGFGIMAALDTEPGLSLEP